MAHAVVNQYGAERQGDERQRQRQQDDAEQVPPESRHVHAVGSGKNQDRKEHVEDQIAQDPAVQAQFVGIDDQAAEGEAQKEEQCLEREPQVAEERLQYQAQKQQAREARNRNH